MKNKKCLKNFSMTLKTKEDGSKKWKWWSINTEYFLQIRLSALSKCQILTAKEQVKKLALDSKICIFWLTIYPIKKTIRDIVLKVQIYQLLRLGNRNWIKTISPNICKIMRQRRLFQCKEIRLLNKIRDLNHLLILRLLL